MLLKARLGKDKRLRIRRDLNLFQHRRQKAPAVIGGKMFASREFLPQPFNSIDWAGVTRLNNRPRP